MRVDTHYTLVVFRNTHTCTWRLVILYVDILLFQTIYFAVVYLYNATGEVLKGFSGETGMQVFIRSVQPVFIRNKNMSNNKKIYKHHGEREREKKKAGQANLLRI